MTLEKNRSKEKKEGERKEAHDNIFCDDLLCVKDEKRRSKRKNKECGREDSKKRRRVVTPRNA